MYSFIYVQPLEKPKQQSFSKELSYADSFISCKKSVFKDFVYQVKCKEYTRIPIIANMGVGFTIFIEQIKDLEKIEKTIYMESTWCQRIY